MKLLLSTVFLFLFIVGVNAQQQAIGSLQLKEGRLMPNKTFVKTNAPINVKSKTSNASLISDGFIPKAGCIDTLSYPLTKQFNVDQQELYLYDLDDDVPGGLNETVMAQEFRIGNTPMAVSGVELFIRKIGADFSNVVSAEISIYTLSGGVPTTKIGSVMYTVPDTVQSLKYVNFVSPINVSSDFAVAVTLKTPGKTIQLLVTDPAYSATYDEKLSYFGAQGYSMMSFKDLYAAQPTPSNTDFDVVIHPIVSYNVDVPAFTANPTTACVNQSVSLQATYTPTAAVTNRFLNYYAFMNHFNFNSSNYSLVILPNGLSDQSVFYLTSASSHTYTAAGSYPAYFQLDAGFQASCIASNTVNVTVNTPPDATFSYTGTNYCQSSAAATPTITTTGGTFSVTPTSGLSINATTGEIDFSSSTIGDYTVQYVVANGTCSDTKTANVKVVSTLDASFSYANSDYCVNDVTPASVVLGANASAGTFSASPAGLSINATTGEIDLASSTVGSYTVTNTVNGTGGCAGDAKTFGVEIKAIPDAAFTYTNTNYCQASPSATPTPTTTGGTYSVTPATGLSIDATTGVIDFTSSTIGNYTVQYVVTNGTCSDTKTTNVNVISGSDASFSYANSSYCTTGATSAPVVLGASASAGTFSASPAGLTINATTGEIDLATSTVGNYTVTNTVSATGGCAGDSKTFAVSINAGPDATITPVSAVCENDNVINLSAATTGGTFSGNGVANGLFNPATAGSGLHTITYDVTVSGCTSSATTVIQVDALPPSVAFTMPSTTCKNDSPIALTGTPSGGIFTGAGVSGTTFDPSVAGVGSHAIVYTVSSGVCNASKTNTIVVDSCLAIDNADMIQVKLFPIPAENELTIFVNADVEVQVLSIDGKLLIAPFKVANEVSYVLNTKSLARGMYLLKLTTDNGFEKTQRIMLK